MRENCLFQNITVVTPIGGSQTMTTTAAWVAVKDGLISYAGDSELAAQNMLEGHQYVKYNGHHKIMLPAMANTHGHIAMTLLRNQADDCNLHDWLFKMIFPRETRLNQQTVYTGTMLGLAEMIRSGTGAAADMYYYSESVARAALETGFRLNFCCDAKTADVSGKVRIDPDLLADHLRQYQQHPSGLLRVSLLVHSVYLYETSLYPELADMARDLNCSVQVHVSETSQEVADCLQKHGSRPPRQLEKYGFFQTPTIAAHCVHLDDEDRHILASHQVLVAHNPSSNLKLGSGIADLPSMIKAGIRIGLGTDGAASNNNLDMYREMRLASFLAKGLSGDASALSASMILDMATQQGMIGLGFPRSGRIEAGFQADLQIVDYDSPAMTPLGEPASALVYSSGSGCVESLMVDGCWLMRQRALLTIDEEKVLYEARQESAFLNGK
jgi:5-methylthioadenosine/S-adenosylhomocysteine deaminase